MSPKTVRANRESVAEQRAALAVDAGRRAAARIAGPGIGDASAPLRERCEVFSARLAAFRAAAGTVGENVRAGSRVDTSGTCRACGCRTVDGGICTVCGASKGVDDGASDAG